MNRLREFWLQVKRDEVMVQEKQVVARARAVEAKAAKYGLHMTRSNMSLLIAQYDREAA